MQIRTGSDSILSDQDWTRTEKFHSPLISAARPNGPPVNVIPLNQPDDLVWDFPGFSMIYFNKLANWAKKQITKSFQAKLWNLKQKFWISWFFSNLAKFFCEFSDFCRESCGTTGYPAMLRLKEISPDPRTIKQAERLSGCVQWLNLVRIFQVRLKAIKELCIYMSKSKEKKIFGIGKLWSCPVGTIIDEAFS